MILRNFWYAQHDLPLRGINFEPYRAVKMPTPVGWVFLWYARHDLPLWGINYRATYRVGVFRHILIKCCVFKGCTVFADNTCFF